MSHKRILCILLALMTLLLCGCAAQQEFYQDIAASEPAPDVTMLPTAESTIPEPEITEPSAEPSTEAPVVTTLMFTTTSVNVRTGPSPDHEIICPLPPHTEVEKLRDEDGWCLVRIDGTEYYMSGKYLTEKVENSNGYLVVIDAGHQG